MGSYFGNLIYNQTRWQECQRALARYRLPPRRHLLPGHSQLAVILDLVIWEVVAVPRRDSEQNMEQANAQVGQQAVRSSVPGSPGHVSS